MNQRATDTPEQALKFAPKEKAHANGSPLDEAGKATSHKSKEQPT
jgi:hypothetical protein